MGQDAEGNEVEGPVEALLGTVEADSAVEKMWMEPVTENPAVGATLLGGGRQPWVGRWRDRQAARLQAQGVIKTHRDTHPSFHYGHRIHLPIVTNPRVRFMIDGRPYKLEVGKVYEINNQLVHSVMNKGTEARINFIFDYVPPQHLGREVANA